MTEKDYSGATTAKIGKNAKVAGSEPRKSIKFEQQEKAGKQRKSAESAGEAAENEKECENYIKAGQIAKKAKEYAKTIIKPGVLLADIAEKIEAKIIEMGGELAFPVNLSIDDVAAHYSPSLHDTKKAESLLKVDLGVHVSGCVADTAFSLDLTPEKKHQKLIEASEKALRAAIELVKKNKAGAILSEIGKEIKSLIENYGFAPVRNLSGHSLSKYDLHAGLTIPNYDNGNTKSIGEGAFAIEPFATAGAGVVYDGGSSNIYHLSGDSQVRDNFSREVYAFIIENKKTLPFSQRELEKKFGGRIFLAISNLKRAGIIEEYAQLVEKAHKPISQAEHTLIISGDKVDVTTE